MRAGQTSHWGAFASELTRRLDAKRGSGGQGLAILMISSELTEILGMSDRILVMREGRLVGELPRAAASQEAIAGAMVGGEREPAAVAGAA